MKIRKLLDQYEDLNTELGRLLAQVERTDNKDFFINSVMKINKKSDELYSNLLDYDEEKYAGFINTAQIINTEISEKLSIIYKLIG